MLAGRLRHRVLFERQVLTANAFGETVETFAPIQALNADVKPISGKEFLTANAMQSQNTHRIWVRYYPGLNATNRIRFGHDGERKLDVTYIRNVDERNKMLEMLAIELRVDNEKVTT